MAYLILADRQGEFDRRELTGPVIVGRGLDCDLVIRDILLSRKHCRIEPFNNRWVIEDLGSKNGTRIGSEVVTRHILTDGEVVRIGKMQICFYAGKFVPPPKSQQRAPEVRAADPKEALSGTVLGFQLFDMEEDSRVSGFPIPKPKPPEPASLRQPSVSSIVSQMTSTSWDVALSEQPKSPRPMAKAPVKPIIKVPKPLRPPVQRSVPPPVQRSAPPPIVFEPPSEPTPSVSVPVSVPVLPELPFVSEPGEPTISLNTVLSAAIEEAASPTRRRLPPDGTHISPWLVRTYIALATLIGLGSIGVIVVKSSNVVDWSSLGFNWLAQ